MFSSKKKKKKKKKKRGKESQYMVSHPETGSDSPIGSNQESGRDINSHSSHLDIFSSS